jgi:hypothetical protein
MGMFGLSKKNVWSNTVASIGAVYVDKTFKTQPHIEKTYKNRKIIMETYMVNTGKSATTLTRARMCFIRENDIIFKVMPKNIFSGFAGIFKMPAVETYDYDFNDRFVVRGNDEPVIREIFENKKIRELIKEIGKNRLELKRHKKNDKSEIYYQFNGVLKDEKKIENVFELFETMLDGLVKAGAASEKEPRTVI